MKLSIALIAVFAAVVLGQEGPESRPRPEIRLPVADQAKPFATKDAIQVTVFTAKDVPVPESRKSDELAPWRIRIGDETLAFDREGMKALGGRLRMLADTKDNLPSQRELVILADAAAPWGAASKILEQASVAGIYRTSVAAESRPSKTLHAIACPLPIDKAGPPPDIAEIRVLMAWNLEQRKVERISESQKLFPPTAEGNAVLEAWIRSENDRLAKEGNAVVVVVIDAGPLVPWDQIVAVLNAARRAGVDRVEFGFSQLK